MNSKFWLPSSFGIILVAYFLNKQEYTENIETGQGKLKGLVRESRQGRKYSVFYGVPYGEPPVGDLRYQSPVPARNWTEVLVADKYGIECLQIDLMMKAKIVGQEDCLRLNIFTANDLIMPKFGKLFPVVVFVHGGGFMSGSSKLFKGDYFMDEDVVVVTFNYRLGILGFLTTGDQVIRGNMGLKDQNLALRWVQGNIKHFGGDPNKVTLMGESAGASCVHLHMMSGKSRGLFHKAISLSGNAWVPWGSQRDPVGQFENLGKQINCDTTSTSSFLQCLQKLDPAEILELHKVNRHPMVDPLEQYGPTFELFIDSDTFWSDTIICRRYTSKNFTPVPWLMGVNEGEGLVFVARMLADQVLNENIKKISEWHKCLPRFLYFDKLSEENLQKITNFYFNADGQDFNPFDKFENLTNMLSDRLFYFQFNQVLELYQNETNGIQTPLHLYYYTYRGHFSLYKLLISSPTGGILPFEVKAAITYIKEFVFKIIYGQPERILPASHADELSMIFNVGYIFTINTCWSQHYNFSVELVKTIGNFIKTSGHTLEFNGKTWPSVQSNRAIFMKLDKPEESGLIPSPFAERMSFWKSLNLNDCD